jgi:threonine dehydratase
MKLSLADILAARQTIAGAALRTPLIPSPFLSGLAGRDFMLKLENTQPIGAFKLRGAANAVFSLPDRVKGVTCCSTGNHGRGIAYAAKARGLRAVVCMSSLVPRTKVDGIRSLGAEVRIVGKSQDDAQMESTRLCKEEGLVEIPPFDHRFVIAGQGTIGLELMEDRPDIETVLVPLSGGGLAAGVALAVKAIKPQARVIGISMDRGAAMHASIKAGHPVEVEEVPSLADSLGGGIGLENSLTFEMCGNLLDDIVLVTEEEIYRAMQTLYYEDRIVAEGACVVGIAALQSGKLDESAGPIATIITGRNVDMQIFTSIMNGRDVQIGSLRIKGQSYGS